MFQTNCNYLNRKKTKTDIILIFCNDLIIVRNMVCTQSNFFTLFPRFKIPVFKFPETWDFAFFGTFYLQDFYSFNHFSGNFIGSLNSILGKKRPRNPKPQDFISRDFFSRDLKKFGLFSRVFNSGILFTGHFFPLLSFMSSINQTENGT